MLASALAALMLGLQSTGPFPEGKLDLSGARDLNGKAVALPAAGAKATVLIFMLVDCPVSNRYSPEVSRIAKEYGSKGVSFFRVYVDPALKKSAAEKHSRDYQLGFPALYDREHRLVKALGATITPEAAVINPEGRLLYRGRIDDRYVEHARIQESGFRLDLRIALDEVLAGKKVTLRMTPAIGCFIPPLPDSEQANRAD